MTREPDFGRLAPFYDELRPADESWWAVTDALVGEGELRGRRVLDVGCGTGRFAAALAERYSAKVWGVDPSPEMLAVARANAPAGVGLKAGRAEELPFRDGWFERVVARLSLHLVDRSAALREALRVLVPGGRLGIATFDPAHFDRYWLNGFFPSVREIDLARFPSLPALSDELAAAGFAAPRVTRLRTQTSIDRETALDRVRRKHISTLELIPDDEYREGLARAERELPDRSDVTADYLIVTADRGGVSA